MYLKRPWYSSGAASCWRWSARSALLGVAARHGQRPDGRERPAGGRRRYRRAHPGPGGDQAAPGRPGCRPAEKLVASVQKLTDPAPGDRAEVQQADGLHRLPGDPADDGSGGDPSDLPSRATRSSSSPAGGATRSGVRTSPPPARGSTSSRCATGWAPGCRWLRRRATRWRPSGTAQVRRERGLWYCDIDIDAGTSYFPFVRLGLARYQPLSIPGVHLSRVVTPRWAQLLPSGAASMTRPVPDRAVVSLRGPAGYNAGGGRGSGRQPPRRGPRGWGSAGLRWPRWSGCPPAPTTDLAWTPVGDEVRLALSIVKPYSDIRFSGALAGPAGQGGGEAAHHRPGVRDPADRPVAGGRRRQATTPSPWGAAAAGGRGTGELVATPTIRPVRFRLVYADHLPL